MERFVYEAPHGGDIFSQEGGYANFGIDATTGEMGEPNSLGMMWPRDDDVLELACKHFFGEGVYEGELPPFRLIIEPL